MDSLLEKCGKGYWYVVLVSLKCHCPVSSIIIILLYYYTNYM